ncbi:hypothetical protein PIB30_070061, partial [Stylosanthes scabra]|nr:hypothetical protein [Stylosanthes scabra]
TMAKTYAEADVILPENGRGRSLEFHDKKEEGDGGGEKYLRWIKEEGKRQVAGPTVGVRVGAGIVDTGGGGGHQFLAMRAREIEDWNFGFEGVRALDGSS